MKYVKTYEGFFDKVKNYLSDRSLKIKDVSDKKKFIKSLLTEINSQFININYDITSDYAKFYDILGHEVYYVQAPLSGEFKLYIDMIDYTEFDTNISNALFMLHQRSILLIGRLEKLLRLQTMEDRKKLIDNIKDFDVISDIYNKNPFDMIRMNDLFDFYNIKFDEEYATKALFR